jgi:GNAT superfamily N-acetyltransferase
MSLSSGGAVRPATRAAGARIDWVCARHSCSRGETPTMRGVSRVCEALSAVTSRVAVQRWIRYRIGLAQVPPPEDVELTPLSHGIVALLRNHPDHEQEAFASGLAFWDLGLRNGLVWFEGGQPLCFQWLLSQDDVALLRAGSAWANMYPPLEERTGQLEKLWTFSTARKKGVASRFALAMFAQAKQRGYETLVTHIHEANEAARSWAVRTGWQSYGTIERYEFDLPLLRSMNLSVCTHRSDGEPVAVD